MTLALALMMMSIGTPDAAAQTSAAVVVTRPVGKRPRARQVQRFSAALGKSLQAVTRWQMVSGKTWEDSLDQNRSLSTWSCEPTPMPPEALDLNPVGGGPAFPLDQESIACAVEFARRSVLDRLILVHVYDLGGRFLIDAHHIRVDVGVPVASLHQYVQSRKFREVLAFAPALARRLGVEYGELAVDCNVEGAEVEFNGQYLGKTPVEPMRVEVGAYPLKVTADGYFDWEQKIDVSPGVQRRINVELKLPRVAAPTMSHFPSPYRWVYLGVGASAVVGGLALVSGSYGRTALGGAVLGFAGTVVTTYTVVYKF